MIWGYLHRWWTQRRLASALDMVGPMGGEQGRALDGLSRKEQAKLLEQLVAGMETRDPYLHGHSRRVARHSWMIAKRMGLPRAEVARIRTAAAIHDVGKINTPKAILHKPGALSDKEYEVIKLHPGEGALMATILRDPALTSIVRHHHERLDGTGYPDGLAGIRYRSALESSRSQTPSMRSPRGDRIGPRVRTSARSTSSERSPGRARPGRRSSLLRPLRGAWPAGAVVFAGGSPRARAFVARQQRGHRCDDGQGCGGCSARRRSGGHDIDARAARRRAAHRGGGTRGRRLHAARRRLIRRRSPLPSPRRQRPCRGPTRRAQPRARGRPAPAQRRCDRHQSGPG